MNKNLFLSLEQALKKDPRFISNDTEQVLLKNLIRQAAEQLDEALISLLLDESSLREVFFKPISDVIVFDSRKFITFLNNKEFLPDSYTAFKNKVGLSNTAGDYLSDSDEVVLSFPYKDCVLAGGQDKEDTKRQEVFYNEVLGRDEIDRLLDPKTFTNFKKYTSAGEEKLSGFTRGEDGTIKDNLIIKGNNLLALHSLKKEFAGKVKLIYIDPPYNTGSDSFHYNDRFNHSTWLTFMKNRLEVARQLLRDDGVIFVQCDDNEQAYLKVLMDEIFENNLVTTICVQMSYVSGEKMAHVDKKPPKIKEFIHFFSKKNGIRIKPQFTDENVSTEYNKFIEKNNSNNSDHWEVFSLKEVLIKMNINIKDEVQVEEFMLENSDVIFNRVRNKSEVFMNTLGNYNVTKVTTSTGLKKYAWNGREVVFLSDRVSEDINGFKTYQQAIGDIWKDIPIVNLYLEGDTNFSGGKKPEKIIYRIIDMCSIPGDIVLDYHLGSGTTAAVAHKMGRQYIGVEQMDYIEDIAVERMKKVLDGEQGGISNSVEWKGGGEFVYMEMMEANQKYLDKISSAKDTKALLAIYKEIQESGFINYYVDIKTIDENISEFEALSLDNQKKFLAELLDKNLLYVNHSEIEDETYGVSDEEKKLNREFYK